MSSYSIALCVLGAVCFLHALLTILHVCMYRRAGGDERTEGEFRQSPSSCFFVGKGREGGAYTGREGRRRRQTHLVPKGKAPREEGIPYIEEEERGPKVKRGPKYCDKKRVQAAARKVSL